MTKITFLRALDTFDKADLLRKYRSASPGSDGILFTRLASELRAIPLTPFAYWLSPHLRSLFRSGDSTSAHIETRVGMSSLDDFRFIRNVWEVPPGTSRWRWYARGELQRPYFDTSKYLVDWADDGKQVKAYVAAKVGSASRKIQAESFYFRPGLTWVRRTSRLTVRCLPAGFIFSGGAQAAFEAHESQELRLGFLGLANSLIFDALIKVSVGRTGDAVQFESGMIDRTPWPRVNAFPAALGDLARSIWSSYRELDRSNEVSPAFELPTLLRVTKSSFGSAVSAADKFYRESIRAISQNQDDLDELCFRLYNVSDTDRKALTTDAAVMVESHSSASDEIDIANKDQVDDSQVVTAVTPQRYAASLTSWAVGVALGRFDIRLATGERKYPEAPEPFDPLDMCPAGMLTSAAGVPLEVAPPGYPVEISPILVDDPGHPADITARLRRVFDVVFGDHADRWWIDVGSVLGGRDGEISAWLAKGLFAHHLDIYHVPRSRQAPIFWPIGTRSGSYLVWMYAHRISADSLFLILNDLVAPKLLAEERRLSQLRQEAGPGGTASQRRAIDVQDRLVDEIRELRELLQAVAPLWAPDLNDGVVIVLAPLWRLFAHHRAWSSELKKHWVKLSRGDFDWAQLAMHLWPDRVVPKCAEDRSIAIAHGLEEVFWVADPANKDKWTRRKTPVIPMEELIAQHRNPAVSAALERMGNQ